MTLLKRRHCFGSGYSVQAAQLFSPRSLQHVRTLHQVAFAFSAQPRHFPRRVEGKRYTTRINGTIAQAEEARAQLLLKGRAESQRNENLGYQGGTGTTRAILSNPELPEPRNSSPTLTLADWLTDRYSRWQLTSQNETTRRKLETLKRYLIASDLGSMALSKIGTADINAYIEWRHKIGALTFARRKEGAIRISR